jgi:hypothetical protein
MGHCCKSGHALFASTVLQGMKPCSKNCDDFQAVGHSTRFGLALWAVAQDLLDALGNRAKPNITAENYTTFKKLALFFKWTVLLKSVFY